jgi:hypothetical protein
MAPAPVDSAGLPEQQDETGAVVSFSACARDTVLRPQVALGPLRSLDNVV